MSKHRFSIEVKFGEVKAVGRDDIGADTTITPALFLKYVTSHIAFLAKSLEKSFEIELAVQDESIPKVAVNRDVRASITIIIQGCRLPVRVRNARVLVAEMERNSVLLGRDLLDYLSFNFRKYISESYESVKYTEMKSKVKVRSYTGAPYVDQNEDPTEPQIYLSE